MSSLAVHPRRPAPADRSTMVHIDDVVRVFGRGDGQVRALDGVTLSMARGTFTAIMGPSGSGKSTLLQIAAGLDRPTQGTVQLGDEQLNGLNERALARLRRERIGFIFQSFNLLGALTAEQNVALPSRLAGKRLARSVVRDALNRVGLDGRRGHRPAQLSGGQQQRVAIARALRGEPSVMFADEPTRAPSWATRALCPPGSRRARSTHAQGAQCWRCCARRSTKAEARSSWSPTIRRPPPGQTASSSWPTGSSPASWTPRPPSRWQSA